MSALRSFSRPAAQAVCALLLACVPALAAAAAPTAGTAIDNQAEASFFDTDSGYHVRVRSNAVRVTVQAQEALTLAPPLRLGAAIGGFVRLPHRLVNTGNTASRYALTVSNLTGDEQDLLDLALVLDRNGNGQADPGEPVFGTSAGVVLIGPLAPGESADLVIQARVPATAALGHQARLELTARTQAQAMQASVQDEVTIGDGAQLQISKTASHTQATPGQVLRFTLTASNNGNRAAAAVPVRIDGASAMVVLMRDRVPANTRFAGFGPGSSSPVASALYHLHGEPEHQYRSAAPADLGAVDAVAFAWRDPIARGQSASRSFDVQVNANASAPIDNTAQFVFNDGLQTGAQSTDSNPVQVSVPVQPPRLRYFADAQYSQPLRVTSSGARLFVEADAAQCNLDARRIETQRLTVRSALTGDAETFLAEETGPNTGVFHVQPHVQTVDAGQSPVVAGDGRVATRRGDRIVTTLAGCGAVQVDIDALIDPFGVVFDSRSNLPLAGAVVALIDVSGAGNGGHAGGAARVLQADAATPA
jgi:large repetitive protein